MCVLDDDDFIHNQISRVSWVFYASPCIHGIYKVSKNTLFMLERMIEMAKVRKDCLFVAFIDMEKAYDRVNRKKLFEVMRGYGVQFW